MNVLIYTKENCGYCRMAKQWLKEHNVPYEEVAVDNDQKRQALYEELAGRYGVKVRTVPQILLIEDGLQNHIGGYSELLRSDLAKRAEQNFDNLDF